MVRKKKGPLGVFRLYTEREKDQYIGAFVAEWEKEKRQKKKAGKAFITISRQYGCMALETGLRFAERLDKLDPNDCNRFGMEYSI